MTDPDIEKLRERLKARPGEDHERGCDGRNYACSCGFNEANDALFTEAATALRSEHARAVKAEAALWDGDAPVSWQERALKAESRAVKAEEEVARRDGKRAPVQGYPQGIPWWLHLEAYEVYCKRYGAQIALIDLEGRNCRGGFGTEELDSFVPGWRERVSEFGVMKSRALTAEAAVKVLREAVDPLANETDQVSVWNGTSHEVVLPPAEDRAPAFNIFYGDIRRARAARAQTASYGEGE